MGASAGLLTSGFSSGIPPKSGIKLNLMSFLSSLSFVSTTANSPHHKGFQNPSELSKQTPAAVRMTVAGIWGSNTGLCQAGGRGWGVGAGRTPRQNHSHCPKAWKTITEGADKASFFLQVLLFSLTEERTILPIKQNFGSVEHFTVSACKSLSRPRTTRAETFR